MEANQAVEDGFSQILSEAMAGGLLRLTLSRPVRDTYKRAVFRPSGKNYSLELFKNSGSGRESLGADGVFSRAASLFPGEFSNAAIETAGENIYLRVSKSGKLLVSRGKKPETDAPAAPPAHNRRKNYLIPEGEPLPVLRELGVFTAEGHVAAPMYDKFRQINRYIEFIDDIVSKDSRPEWNIIDFGCGKSYLTFVLYHYLVNIKGRRANITGLDLKKDVIARCATLAADYGYSGLSFRLGDIRDYSPREKPDMVISLHACDTATDYALFNAVSWGSDYILAVPCCQHELNLAAAPGALPPLTGYGIIKERFCALSTDAVRGKLLEYKGYKVDIAEFVDIAHSPKNLLIRARRLQDPPPARGENALAQARALLDALGTSQTLYRLFVSGGAPE